MAGPREEEEEKKDKEEEEEEEFLVDRKWMENKKIADPVRGRNETRPDVHYRP